MRLHQWLPKGGGADLLLSSAGRRHIFIYYLFIFSIVAMLRELMRVLRSSGLLSVCLCLPVDCCSAAATAPHHILPDDTVAHIVKTNR